MRRAHGLRPEDRGDALAFLIEEGANGQRHFLGLRILQPHHLGLALVGRAGVEPLDDLRDKLHVMIRAAHQQAVRARIDRDRERTLLGGAHGGGGHLILAHGRAIDIQTRFDERVLDAALGAIASRRGCHAKHLHEQGHHLVRVGVLEGEDLDLRKLRRAGVEPGNDLFEQSHVIHRAADDQRIHPAVGRDENRLLERGSDQLLALLAARDELQHGLGVRIRLITQRCGLGVQSGVEDGREGFGARKFQREDLDLADAGDELGIEFLHQLTDALGVRFAAGNDNGVDAFIGGHRDGQRGAGSAFAEKSLNGLRDTPGVGLGQGEEVDGNAGVSRVGIKPQEK